MVFGPCLADAVVKVVVVIAVLVVVLRSRRLGRVRCGLSTGVLVSAFRQLSARRVQ